MGLDVCATAVLFHGPVDADRNNKRFRVRMGCNSTRQVNFKRLFTITCVTAAVQSLVLSRMAIVLENRKAMERNLRADINALHSLMNSTAYRTNITIRVMTNTSEAIREAVEVAGPGWVIELPPGITRMDGPSIHIPATKPLWMHGNLTNTTILDHAKKSSPYLHDNRLDTKP